jgi:NADPH2:quinone reductase
MLHIKTMAAVGFYEGLPIEAEASFLDLTMPVPEPEPRDILVAVRSVSINPVDTKLRAATPKQPNAKIIGFDAVGKVIALGAEVSKFAIGDRVFYAGTTTRSGSHQAFQLVDERIAALAPEKLTDEAAAALPLTALTAYELLFEKFGLIPSANANQGKKLLVINGAGGVGSILTQMAHWTGLEVIATASEKNFPWLIQNKVTHPIDYHIKIKQSLKKIGIKAVDYIAVLYDITQYFDQIQELIQPFGHVGTIVGINQPIDMNIWKNRSVSFDWEYMFAKTDFNFQIETQGQILTHIAELADQGVLTSPVTKIYSEGINAQTIKQATAEVETGHMQGKVVVSGPFNNSNHSN